MNTIGTYSVDKDTRSKKNSHIANMVTYLKKGNNDYVNTKDHVLELSDLLGSNNILIARKSNSMYNVKIATIFDLTNEIKEWAKSQNLDPKDSRTLKRFVEETRIIWA